jgi:hypothetical protein
MTGRGDPEWKPEPDPLPPGFRLDRYVIEGELTPAGMGRIYKAIDTTVNETVAINVLSPTLRDPEGLARFRMAFRRAFYNKRGQVHDYGEWHGIPFATVAYDQAAGRAVDVSKE